MFVEYDRDAKQLTVNGPLTQLQVAVLLGVSRARIVALEQRALRKLRRDPEVSRLMEMLDVERGE